MTHRIPVVYACPKSAANEANRAGEPQRVMGHPAGRAMAGIAAICVGVLLLVVAAGATLPGPILLDQGEHYLPVHEWESVASLPQGRSRWSEDWRFYKQLDLRNPTDMARPAEPVEADAEFHADQVTDLAREIRVVEVASDDGPLREMPSQVYGDLVEDGVRRCRLFFLADLAPRERKTYLVLYGNPSCPPPAYPTDLRVAGEGYALDIENSHYRVEMARTNGNLKNLHFRPEGPSFYGHGPPMTGAHGVEGTVHWNPDWCSKYAGRYRVTNWPEPPNWDVVRGPICVQLKRWGHPILALGPEVGRPERVMATVTYTFYASVPYFVMESRLEALEDVWFLNCRNDEWVGLGGVPDAAWMTDEGEIDFGARGWERENPAWMTLFNRGSGRGFASLRLAYKCTHPDWPEPSSVNVQDALWVRYPLEGAMMRSGDYVMEKNAYLLHQYEPPGESAAAAPREGGFGMLMDYYGKLSHPLVQEKTPPGPKPLTVRNVLDALSTFRDTEVYIGGSHRAKRMLNVVDLGLIRAVEIDGDSVHIAMVVPYVGRETWFGWYAKTMEDRIRERIEGVEEVKVALVRDPPWSPDQMTARARRLVDGP